MKTARQYFTGIKSEYAPELIECSLRGSYAVALFAGDDPHGMHHAFPGLPARMRYHVIVVNRETGAIVDDMSDVIYHSSHSAREFIESLGPVEHATRERKPAAPANITTFTADYARVVYDGADVTVQIQHDNATTDVHYARRKSWSHRKYVDRAMNDVGARPSYDFRYGWDMTR